MDEVKFLQTTTADGPDGMPRAFAAGDVVPAAAVLPGCLASLLRLGRVVPVSAASGAETFAAAMSGPAADPPPPDLTAGPPADPEPKPKPKKK